MHRHREMTVHNDVKVLCCVHGCNGRWPFFRDHPGELVPEENLWTLWCKGRLTEADTPTIRLGATLSGLTSAHLHYPHIFYRPDALPAAQPAASKHCRQMPHHLIRSKSDKLFLDGRTYGQTDGQTDLSSNIRSTKSH